MPKPNWDKKTISTYITQQQKEVWEKTAISECKQVADFVRDRVESTINNENYKGKVCVWLDVPKELIDKAKKPGEKNKNKTNPNPGLFELIQNHVYRVVNEDTVKELQWEQSANNPDIETLKAKNLELERQIELLKSENENLRNRGTVSENNEIFKVLDKEKFLSLEKIAVLLNRDDDVKIHELQDEIEETMFKVGMIEFKLGRGGGYRYNPEIEPVERAYSGKKIKIEVE